jgi:peptide/nickel transport system substrate-binding protein
MLRRRSNWLLALTALVLFLGGWAVARGGGDARRDRHAEVRIGIYALAPSRGDPFRMVGAPGMYVWSAIYDALTEIGPGGVPGPSLATGWTREGDLRWRFHVRPGVRFADGAKLTPQAVIDSLEIVRKDYGFTGVGALLASVRSMRADGDAVLIETQRPNAALPSELAGAYIVPAHAWRKLGASRFAGAAFGTGPFRLERWDPARVDLVANPGSWRKPTSQRLTFVELPEEAARISALASNGIDLAIHLSPEAVQQVDAIGVRVVQWPAPIMLSMAFDMRGADSPFRDLRVRRAFNLAVDKQAMARYVMNGQTQPASQPATPAALGFNPDVTPYPYDPAQARALLKAAHYDFKRRLTVDIAINSIPGDLVLYSAAAADLRRVGVNVEIRALPVANWIRRLSRIEFDGPLFGFGIGSLPRVDAINAIRPVTCGRNPPPAFTCTPSLDPLIQAVEAEGDTSRRVALMQRLMQAAHDEAVALFLVNSVDFMAVMPGVRGFAPKTRFIHWELVHKGVTA